jgi:hypothetical protein
MKPNQLTQKDFFSADGLQWTGKALVVARATSIAQIARFIERLEHAGEAMQFAIGDAVNAALAFDGELAEKQILGGFNGETRRGYAWVAAKFNPARRRIPALSFRHHALVASDQFSREEADRWLDEAEKSGWSTRELKAALVAQIGGDGGGGGAASQSLPTFTELFRIRDAIQNQVLARRPIEQWNRDEAKELADNLEPIAEWHTRARKRAELADPPRDGARPRPPRRTG